MGEGVVEVGFETSDEFAGTVELVDVELVTVEFIEGKLIVVSEFVLVESDFSDFAGFESVAAGSKRDPGICFGGLRRECRRSRHLRMVSSGVSMIFSAKNSELSMYFLLLFFLYFLHALTCHVELRQISKYLPE